MNAVFFKGPANNMMVFPQLLLRLTALCLVAHCTHATLHCMRLSAREHVTNEVTGVANIVRDRGAYQSHGHRPNHSGVFRGLGHEQH